MRSSTTPPDGSSQHRLYCARPGAIRPSALVRQASTYAAAPGPRTPTLPRWLTSKRPTRCRTASCSRRTPPPGYSIGMSQPPKSASLAPSATCRSYRAVRRPGASLMAPEPTGVPATDPWGCATNLARSPTPPTTRTPVASLTVSTDRPDQVRADVLVLAVAAPGRPDGDPELLGDVPDAVRAVLPAGVLRALGVTG